MIITKRLTRLKKFVSPFAQKFTVFGQIKKNFSEETETVEKVEEFKNEDFDQTGLRVEKTKLTDFRRSRYFDVRLRNEGEFFIPREYSDDMHLLTQGIILDHEPLSAYYSMEVNDRIFHVFNAERYVIIAFFFQHEFSFEIFFSFSLTKFSLMEK